MNIADVKPLYHRSERSECCGMASGWTTFSISVYPESPHGEMLRKRRIALGLSLSEAASAIGIEREVLSKLENGSALITDSGGWDAALRALGTPT